MRTVDESTTIVAYSELSLEIPRLTAYFPFESADLVLPEFYSQVLLLFKPGHADDGELYCPANKKMHTRFFIAFTFFFIFSSDHESYRYSSCKIF